MRVFQTIIFCLFLCHNRLCAAEPVFKFGEDIGVSKALLDLSQLMGLGKQHTAANAEDAALSVELSVRNVTSQVKRFQFYFKALPDEVTSGKAESAFNQAYGIVEKLDQISRSSVSHAARIQELAWEIDLAIPPRPGTVASVR